MSQRDDGRTAATVLPGDTEAYLARVESYIGWDGRPDPAWGVSDVLASKRVIRALIAERDCFVAALREIQYIGGDELSRDECVRVLAIARGFAARMLGAKCIGGTLAPEIEALAERAHRV